MAFELSSDVQGTSLLFKPTYETVFDSILIKTSPGEREGIWPIVELPTYCLKCIAVTLSRKVHCVTMV